MQQTHHSLVDLSKFSATYHRVRTEPIRQHHPLPELIKLIIITLHLMCLGGACGEVRVQGKGWEEKVGSK